MAIKFAYTILYVADVTASISFYENAFGFARKFITPEQDYGELVTGGTTLAFAAIALGEANLKAGFQQSSLSQKPFGIELAFTTEDIDNDFNKALQAGAVEVEAIVEKPWGQRVAYLRDPNGF